MEPPEVGALIVVSTERQQVRYTALLQPLSKVKLLTIRASNRGPDALVSSRLCRMSGMRRRQSRHKELLGLKNGPNWMFERSGLEP